MTARSLLQKCLQKNKNKKEKKRNSNQGQTGSAQIQVAQRLQFNFAFYLIELFWTILNKPKPFGLLFFCLVTNLNLTQNNLT